MITNGISLQREDCGSFGDVVGTLINKADIIIQYYFVLYRLSTDSKTRDLERP